MLHLALLFDVNSLYCIIQDSSVSTQLISMLVSKERYSCINGHRSNKRSYASKPVHRSSSTWSSAWKDCSFTIIFLRISKEHEYALPRRNGISSSIRQAFAHYYFCMQSEMKKYYRYVSQSNFYPELITRVFKAELEEFMNNLTKK